MDSGDLSRTFFDAFRRRDLDTMISMMAEDVRYEMPNVPMLTSRDAVIEMYTTLFEVLGDAEIKLLESIAQDNNAALILSLPGSDEVGGSIFHQWSDDGLLLHYQSFSRS
jgi:ketosteroid isomerase-like protein